ncbi:WG repeat-containing protein [Arsenicibacter rosenii]|uniref:WG repeat-containing protein n=1 Tax=Arsenicibacter rosenii TaxID=1750698 RepID=A0A1S2VH48_9BACT|nr:WG repeat-containing protein [Arsenicibacter rosenii]OIN58049.1 hypothetical protein BLX24_16090 [Arsenicibacter rosenii]
MTVEELRERIKNQIVLHDGDLADWQWTPTGLPAEATELGITDFRRLVNDVSRQLNSYFGRILDLKEKVRVQARKQQKKLSNGDIDEIVQEAERLTLSRGFVADQWIPAILQTVTDVDAAPVIPAAVADRKPVPVAPLSESDASIRQKVNEILDDYDRHIPVQTLRTLFRAINAEEQQLAEAVQAYLSANFFGAETEPNGNTLKEKLLSTDWRHLSWWKARTAPVTPLPAEPVRPPVAQPVNPSLGRSNHPMVDTNYRTPPVAPPPVNVPPRRNLAGFWGVLFALAFMLIIYLMIKGGKKDSSSQPGEQTRTEQTETPSSTKKKGKKKRKQPAEDVAGDTRENDRTGSESSAPVKSLPEYEELRDQVGQYKEQPAMKKGKWGLWRNEKWFIKPIYDDITVFEDGRATVTLGGASFEIDRYGNRVR